MSAILRPRSLGVIQKCLLNQVLRSRNISTSKKNSDTATTAVHDSAVKAQKEEENWVSYGYDYKSKEEDTNWHHASFFFSVTLCLVFGSFLMAYGPDTTLRDWASREAFLELRRREKAGEPRIDPNFIPPSQMKLPSEDELEGMEIVI